MDAQEKLDAIEKNLIELRDHYCTVEDEHGDTGFGWTQSTFIHLTNYLLTTYFNHENKYHKRDKRNV
jgi:hypothetical protein